MCRWRSGEGKENRHEVLEAVLGHQGFWEGTCSPARMLELLQIHAPQVVDAPACLVINAQERSIYLLERSREIPAFWISCGEDPSSQAKEGKTAGREAMITV